MKTLAIMIVVVSILSQASPLSANIVRKGTRKDLAVKKITWDKESDRPGYRFSPKQIAEAGGGPGVYTVKFYSGQKPVITRDFRIVE